jgi:hypothetical protein
MPLIRRESPGRLIDLAALVATIVIISALVRDLVLLLPILDPANIAVDYHLYIDATRRWLEHGVYYYPYQSVGPYEASPGVVLYPPTFILVMLPFLYLPWVLYWVLPIGAVVYAVLYNRPRVVAWPGIALCLWSPGTTVTLVTGNPVLLMVGALALGTIWYWPSVLVFLKPSLLPFAFFGCWRRSWLFAFGALILVSASFLGLWVDWVRVVANARHPLGLLYNVGQVPMMLLPIFVWICRTRPAPRDKVLQR